MRQKISLLLMSMAAADSVSSFSLSDKRQRIDKGLANILEMLNSGTATRLPIVQSAFGLAARIFEISQVLLVSTLLPCSY